MTEYVTVADQELLSTGRRWRGATGEYYVTSEHLADMVAAQADPLIRAPRVKLGHLSVLFQTLAGMHDPAPLQDDAEPAFGSITNLRLDEGATTLIGDLIEVPAWLADAMPSAYPTRSAEWVWDYETAGGKKYSAVLTDVALGGVWEPAVEDLADVTREQAVAALATLLAEGPEAMEAALTVGAEQVAVAAACAVVAAL
jgi:hypothetical protein